MQSEFSLVITTTGSRDSARVIAAHILERKLAACVQIVQIESHFVWQDKINSEGEFALHIKTRSVCFELLQAAIREVHSYETPEIIRLDIAEGYPPYLDWMTKVTTS